MLPELQFSISQNDKVLQTITKLIEGQDFVRSLEDFQAQVNNSLTKMIDDTGVSGVDYSMEEDDSESEDEAEQTPKKKKIVNNV